MKDLDLFKLHNSKDKTPRKWICVIGPNLNKEIDKVINQIVKRKSKKLTFIKVNKDLIKETYRISILKAGNQKRLSETLDLGRQDLYSWREGIRIIPIKALKKLLRYAHSKSTLNEAIVGKREHLLGWTRHKIAEYLSKKIKVNQNFTEKTIYNKRPQIALIFIIELLNLWKKLLKKSKREFK